MFVGAAWTGPEGSIPFRDKLRPWSVVGGSIPPALFELRTLAARPGRGRVAAEPTLFDGALVPARVLDPVLHPLAEPVVHVDRREIGAEHDLARSEHTECAVLGNRVVQHPRVEQVARERRLAAQQRIEQARFGVRLIILYFTAVGRLDDYDLHAWLVRHSTRRSITWSWG